MTYRFPPPLYPDWVPYALPVLLIGIAILAAVAFVFMLRYRAACATFPRTPIRRSSARC